MKNSSLEEVTQARLWGQRTGTFLNVLMAFAAVWMVFGDVPEKIERAAIITIWLAVVFALLAKCARLVAFIKQGKLRWFSIDEYVIAYLHMVQLNPIRFGMSVILVMVL